MGGLAGQGAITIWQDVSPEARAEFYAWHNGEHLAERVAIPGFLRGRRYRALAGEPEFFTLYETTGPEVLTGEEYLARLNAPTDWTRRIAPRMVNNVRALCRVVWSRGALSGGLMLTVRFDAEASALAALRERLCSERLPALVEKPGVAAAHLCIADAAASRVQTEEKKSRPVPAKVPDGAVLVEGAAEREALEAVAEELLASNWFAAAGARDICRGLYQLQAWLQR